MSGDGIPEILPLAAISDLRTVEALAREIWQAHYSAIITQAQMDYMLERGYSLQVMQSEIANGVTYEGLFLNQTMIGYCSYGPECKEVLKLHKLYLKTQMHGKGYGRMMLEHVYGYAKQAGYKTIMLQVNKQNTVAIRAYKGFGFEVVRASVVDIGGGFQMDDFIMEIEVN
jgi:ribosomal protein S18 acetylase RimI-like enzyme